MTDPPASPSSDVTGLLPPELAATIPGALRATLDRFSPGSIQRRRGGELGLLAKLLPIFRDAALWRHYEREFAAVTEEPDEAFLEVFAREFRKARERAPREGNSPRE